MPITDRTLLQLLSTPSVEDMERVVDSPVPTSNETKSEVASPSRPEPEKPTEEKATEDSVEPSLEKPKSDHKLSELLSEKALELLADYSIEELLEKNIKELLSDITAISIAGPWVKENVDGKEILRGDYTFSRIVRATDFVSDLMFQGVHSEIVPDSIHVDKVISDEGTPEKVVKYKVTVLIEGTPELSNKSTQICQYANYKYTSMSSEYSGMEAYSDEAVSLPSDTDPKNIPYTSSKDLAAIPVEVVEENNVKKLRVPVAVIGEWKHKNYGDLKFSQEDFDQMKSNFDSRVIGYEPPLFLGHPTNDQGKHEGDPAEGFLEKFSQTGDVLYGDFECVNDDTYDAVKKGQFRYSSGEFLRNYKSKKSGELVGTTLAGVALTNRPFLTGLPRVTALSEDHDHVSTVLLTDSSVSEVSPISPTTTSNTNTNNTPMTTNTDTVNATENLIDAQKFSEFKQQVREEFDSLKQNYADEVTELKQKLTDAVALNDENAQKLSDLTNERDELAKKVEEVEKEKRDADIAVKLSEIDSFAIPVEEKQKYSDLIKSGALGENESVIMDSLRTISQNLSEAVGGQHGAQTATHALNDPEVVDPYKFTIERNRESVKRQEERLQERLN